MVAVKKSGDAEERKLKVWEEMGVYIGFWSGSAQLEIGQ
jgi:hypothetical protein